MKFILNRPDISELEKKYVNDVLRSEWLSINGVHTLKYQKKISKIINKNFSLAVQSGTAALHVALRALGLRRNDKIIIPNYTCVSNISSASQIGAKPILVDIENETLGLDFNLVKDAIKKYKPKALQIVHVYGHPARDTEKIISLFKKKKIKIIEDVSEALGAIINKKKAGSFGDITVLSTRSEKMIGCGEGGVVSTNDKKLYKNIALIASRHAPYRGKHDPYWKKYYVNGEGYNYLMPHLPGALARAQIERFKSTLLKNKIRVGKLYNKVFQENENYILTQKKLKKNKPVYWLNSIYFKKLNARKVRKIGETLIKKNIEVRSGFWPLNEMKVFKPIYITKKNFSKKMFNQVLVLPSNGKLNIKNIKFIKKEIDKLIK